MEKSTFFRRDICWEKVLSWLLAFCSAMLCAVLGAALWPRAEAVRIEPQRCLSWKGP